MQLKYFCFIFTGMISRFITTSVTKYVSLIAKSPFGNSTQGSVQMNNERNFKRENENISGKNIISHPLVISLFVFNATFIIIIILILSLFSRKLYSKSPSFIENQEFIHKRKLVKQTDENEKNNTGHLLSSTISSNDLTNVLNSCENNHSDCRNPSENAEYTEAKSIYTEMTAVSFSQSECLELCQSLQLPRQPCQSVDENIYLATDTLRFHSETDTKNFEMK